MEKRFQVVVCDPRGEKVFVDLGDTEEQMRSVTVRQLKEKIAQILPNYAGLLFEASPKPPIRLIFADRILDNDSTLLSDYGIQQMSIIFMIMLVPGGGDGGMGDKEGNNRTCMGLVLNDRILHDPAHLSDYGIQ